LGDWYNDEDDWEVDWENKLSYKLVVETVHCVVTNYW